MPHRNWVKEQFALNNETYVVCPELTAETLQRRLCHHHFVQLLKEVFALINADFYDFLSFAGKMHQFTYPDRPIRSQVNAGENSANLSSSVASISLTKPNMSSRKSFVPFSFRSKHLKTCTSKCTLSRHIGKFRNHRFEELVKYQFVPISSVLDFFCNLLDCALLSGVTPCNSWRVSSRFCRTKMNHSESRLAKR